MTELTVGAGYARGLRDFALARGADRRALDLGFGGDTGDLSDPDSRIPFSRYVALMRTAKALTGDPALALHYGEGVDVTEVSIVGLIGQASASMMEAFAQLNRYVSLIIETENQDGGDRFQLVRDHQGLWLVDMRRDANAFIELTETAFAQLVSATRGSRDTPLLRSVHVTHPEPGYGAEYERIFRAPVHWESERNALQIHEAWLRLPVSILPRYAFGILTERAETMLKSLEQSKSVRGRVESLLLTRLHTGKVGMDGIADHLGISRQTLFRKLKAEGVSFERVLDQLRHRLALSYLAGNKVSVNETAYLVGFSDPATFSRAFKRWTGVSPVKVRVAGGAFIAGTGSTSYPVPSHQD